MSIGSKAIALGILAAFASAMFAPGLGAGPQDKGSLTGFIYAQDLKTPVAGAVVKIRNIEDGRELASAPTGADGLYTIAGVPPGRYMLGVTSGEGDFNFDYAVSVKAGELGKLTVSLTAEAKARRVQDVSVKKKGFFNSFAGRAALITAAGVGLYFLIEGEPSPDR